VRISTAALVFDLWAFEFWHGEILFQVRGWPICDINVASGSIFSNALFQQSTFSG
jgi:hypothetical protein